MNSSEAVPETLEDIVTDSPPVEKREITSADRYFLLTQKIPKMISALKSRGGLERVMIAVAKFPLETEKPRLLSADEWILFEAYTSMLNNKFETISTILAERAQKEKNDGSGNTEKEGLAEDRIATEGQERT